MDKENRTVLHLTRVVLDLFDQPLAFDNVPNNKVLTCEEIKTYTEHITHRIERVNAMCAVLEELNFELTYKKNTIYAESANVEAQEIKGILKAKGFKDVEFQVILEYVRKWGML